MQLFRNIIDSVDKKLYVYFAVIYLVFGLLLSVLTPPFHGLDEAAHFNRVYQFTTGHIDPEVSGERVGGVVPQSLIKLQQTSMKFIKDEPDKPDYGYGELFDRSIGVEVDDSEVGFSSFPGAVAYNPIPYLPAVASLAFGSLLTDSAGLLLIIVRVSMLLASIVLGVVSLYLVRNLKIKWLVFAFLIIPAVVFQSSVLSADTLVNSLSILLFSLIYSALHRKSISPWYLALTVSVASLMSLSKFNYLPIALISLILMSRVDFSRFNMYISTSLKALVVAVLIVPTLLWNVQVVSYGDSNNVGRGSVEGYEPSMAGQIKYMVDNPIHSLAIIPNTLYDNGKFESVDYLSRLVGYVGYNAKRMPTLATVSTYILLMISVLYASREITKRFTLKDTIVSLLLAMVSALGVFGVLYVTFTPIGHPVVNGVQGRYFIPLIAFIAPAIAYVMRATLLISTRRMATIAIALSVVNVALMSGYYILLTYRGF